MTHRQRTPGRWVSYFGAKGESRVIVPEIQAGELKRRLDKATNFFFWMCATNMNMRSQTSEAPDPLGRASETVQELNTREESVAVCKMGPRGKRRRVLAAEGIQKGQQSDPWIHAWSDRIDPNTLLDL